MPVNIHFLSTIFRNLRCGLKKALGIIYASRVFFSLPSLRDYDVEVPNFTFCGGRKHKTTTFCFFS